MHRGSKFEEDQDVVAIVFRTNLVQNGVTVHSLIYGGLVLVPGGVAVSRVVIICRVQSQFFEVRGS